MPGLFTNNVFLKEYPNSKDFILGILNEVCEYIGENFADRENVPKEQENLYKAFRDVEKKRDYFERLFNNDEIAGTAQSFFVHEELTGKNLNDVLDEYLKENNYNPIQDERICQLKVVAHKLDRLKNFGDILAAQEGERQLLVGNDKEIKNIKASYKEKENCLKELIGDYSSYKDAILGYEYDKKKIEDRIQTLADNKATLDKKHQNALDVLKEVERSKKTLAQAPALAEERKKYPPIQSIENEITNMENVASEKYDNVRKYEEKIEANNTKKMQLQEELNKVPKEYLEYLKFEEEYSENMRKLREDLTAREKDADSFELEMKQKQYDMAIRVLGQQKMERSAQLDIDQLENCRDMIIQIGNLEEDNKTMEEPLKNANEIYDKQIKEIQDKREFLRIVNDVEGSYLASKAMCSGINADQLKKDEEKYTKIAKNTSQETYDKAVNKEKKALEEIENKIQILQDTLVPAANLFMEIEEKRNEAANETKTYRSQLTTHAYQRLGYFVIHSKDAQKEGHKNGDEYSQLLEKLNQLNQKADNQEADYEEMLKDMAELKTVAKNYLDAKNSQFRPFPSNQRVMRMQFAREIMNYCDGYSRNEKQSLANYLESADIKKPGDKIITASQSYRANRKQVWDEYYEAKKTGDADAIAEAQQKVVSGYTKVLHQVILPESREVHPEAPQLQTEVSQIQKKTEISEPVISNPNI